MNLYGIFGCAFMLCVVILMLSEHKRVCSWIDRFFVWLFPEATGEDL